MGAYFHVAITATDPATATFDSLPIFHHHYDMSKWGEMALLRKSQANALYAQIKETCSLNDLLGEQAGLWVATVCDYDEPTNQFPYGKNIKTYPLKKPKIFDCHTWKNFLTDGIYICDETKSYFDLGYIFNAQKELMQAKIFRDNLYSPLHLLTRKEKECMGGGDMLFDYGAFKSYTDKATHDKMLSVIGTWYAKCVRWQADTAGLDGYQDISPYLVIQEF